MSDANLSELQRCVINDMDKGFRDMDYTLRLVAILVCKLHEQFQVLQMLTEENEDRIRALEERGQ